ncbi:ABC transporter permease [Miltoncostaea oceani]|jgi:peptide/nickel transport system permease protein|uniref:ABC transporter permease n=1 Tax=Miltoncostaea oceani TaxID=2843216 RepID=UPI001C3C5611|nr:ABC transporter permease [Miltoncostaea oceani]
MTRYIIRRLIYVVLVVFAVTLVAFTIFFVLPSTDPAVAFAGRSPTPELIAEVEEQLGLDKPVPVQYGLYIKRLMLGDEYGWPGLGISYNTRSPVREEIISRTAVTLQIAIGGAILWLLIGIPIGVLSALKRRTAADRISMGFALIGVSTPVFLLGLISLYVFWEKLDILPGTGYVPFAEDPVDWFLHMILPWSVLALLFAAIYARVVRGNMIDTMGEDFIRTARAKGVSERRVVARHGLRAGVTPIVTLLGIDLAILVGNTVVTETVFNMPGLGNYILISTDSGDLPGVLAVVVLASFAVALLSLVSDIVYAYLDPRVRYR